MKKIKDCYYSRISTESNIFINEDWVALLLRHKEIQFDRNDSLISFESTMTYNFKRKKIDKKCVR